MKKYLRIIISVIKESSAYRINHIMSILVIVLPLVFTLLLWNAIFAESESIAGYTRMKIITYYILCVLIMDLTYAGVNYEIAEDIRKGKLSHYLIKPLSYLNHSFAVKIGSNIPYFVISFITIFLYTTLVLRVFYLQTNFINILMFIMSLFFGFVLSFIFTFIVSLTAFWLEEISSIESLIGIVVYILSGALLPLSFFPSQIQNIFVFLPFKYLLNFPIVIYLGNLSTDKIFQGLTIQIIWIVIFYIMYLLVWRSGLKRYTSYGG
ncbi:MAG: ABC transporter permease [bacterium]